MTWALHYIGAQFIDEGLRYPTRQWRRRISLLINDGRLIRA